MNAERWDRVQRLIESALAKPAAVRGAFVESACGDDKELREEVLSLLGAGERSRETPELPPSWSELLAGPELPSFTAGERIAHRYLIGRLLGRGGMGEVYEAWDEELSIPVALKTLHLPGDTEEARKQLKREGLLARSVWHPHVCRLYDLGRHAEGEDSTWFLTMELLNGETLSQRLESEGRLPLDRAQRFAEQIAAGLGAAHEAGVVHRDLKPGNIMLVERDGSEQAVVTDFGIARAAAAREGPSRSAEKDADRGPGLIAGTPAYMAPEQVRGEEAGPAADIYAFGVLLYEMVTGSVPFTGDSAIEVARRRLGEEPPSPRQVRPDLTDRWEAAILRCLAPEPDRRFARAEDVAEALAGRSLAETANALGLTARPPHALPAEQEPILGRDAEIADLERDFRGGSRLVTLAGAAGMGKTRLALGYARQQPGEWPGGVWFCDLTEARSLPGIATAVAGALGVQLGPGDPIAQLGHAIAGRGHCLLILDNVEQIVASAAATVSQWLARAPAARFLVTSREKLGLGAQETVHEVAPLSIEAGVKLLTARAQRLRPGLAIAGADAEAAREIVRLADGMPLAIELAGARLRVMSPEAIVAQMRKRFSLLTGGGSARHETLFAAIEGSWELLAPWERSAWVQCTVFSGGFTLEAAESVLDLRAWPQAPWVVDVVQSLVDKSILRAWVPVREAGEGLPAPRFGMFVSLHEYAAMKLQDDPALAGMASGVPAVRAIEARHGRWYARYGTPQAIRALKAQGGTERRRWAERELANLIAACRRATERGDAATAAAAYRAAWAVLDSRGPFAMAVDLGREILHGLRLEAVAEIQVLRALAQAEWYAGVTAEARTHLDAALTSAQGLPGRDLEALVLGDIGGLQTSQGRMEDAARHLERALELARAIGDRHLEANTLNTLSVTHRGQGRMEEARDCAELALAAAQAAGDRRTEGSILSNLGLILQDSGHTEAARARYQAALAIHREVGNRRQEGSTETNLGSLCLDQGWLKDARVHLEAALTLHRETGSRISEGVARGNLGLWHHAQGGTGEAGEHFAAALAIAREVGHRSLEGTIIGALGALHQDRGDREAARSHYESALAIQRATGDRRGEGATLSHLASLLHHRGSNPAAREALATGERLLRQVEARLELGCLLCVRAELEHDAGDADAARTALSEATDLATGMGSGPDSELGRRLARARRALGA